MIKLPGKGFSVGTWEEEQETSPKAGLLFCRFSKEAEAE